MHVKATVSKLCASVRVILLAGLVVVNEPVSVVFVPELDPELVDLTVGARVSAAKPVAFRGYRRDPANCQAPPASVSGLLSNP